MFHLDPAKERSSSSTGSLNSADIFGVHLRSGCGCCWQWFVNRLRQVMNWRLSLGNFVDVVAYGAWVAVHHWRSIAWLRLRLLCRR